jgi:hypothetical protein
VLPLKGIFGQEISPTPIRDALRDAQRHEPDYLIVEVDAEWSEALRGGFEEQELPDDIHQFTLDVHEIAAIFINEIPHRWEKQPEIIFWVKQAMGGAAFLPLISPNVYFHSDARLGGVGILSQMFEGMGDEFVREKQRSLLLAEVEGMAINGGHDPRIVRAMTRTEYVLSVGIEGGRPVLYERMPRPGEELLTHDGTDERFADDIVARARREGRDVLTLRAESARKVGVSRGTADTIDDVLFELGISRNHELVRGRADSIMQQWRDGLSGYWRTLRRLWEEYGQIQVQGDTARERNRERAQQISKLEQIKRHCNRYIEALDPRMQGFPGLQQVDIMIEIHKLEIRADR